MTNPKDHDEEIKVEEESSRPFDFEYQDANGNEFNCQIC